MEILNPWAFLLIVFVPLFLKKKNNNLQKITISSSNQYYFLIAFILLIIALSRPIINNGIISVKLPKTNIIAAIDISKNMQKKDFYPNNLEFAKNKLINFLNYLDNESVSVLLFDKNIYMLTPYNRDYNSITYLLKHIPKINSTYFPSFIKLFKKIKKFKDPKILVIFTSSFISPDAIKKVNIKTFIYAIKKDNSLEKLAKTTQGAIVYANYSNSDIKNLAKLINEINKKRTIKIKDKKELFYYPLLLAIIFIFLGLFKGRK